MKQHSFVPAALALAVLLAACGSKPVTTSLLDQTRGEYLAAQGDPGVTRNAPLEFKQAGDALEQANLAAARGESLNAVDQLAYLAKQKVATAREVARQKASEAQMADANHQRDQLRLEQRTDEADRARQRAEQAQTRAAGLEAQLADLQAKKTERGIVITFGDVLFDVGQAQLSAQGLRTAQKLADVLVQQPQSGVLVEGYTDSTGSPAHNLELSQRRAESVRAALLSMGVSGDRIATRGYGEAFPVASNKLAGNRQLNRRVEIVLSENGTPAAARR